MFESKHKTESPWLRIFDEFIQYLIASKIDSHLIKTVALYSKYNIYVLEFSIFSRYKLNIPD